ncbi:MAG: HAMP domain-containing histidine kinase [Candidatus Latescibacteria bacterium]|nr:HAMP domain-containing histidine kinase [Candidatus Latescibacterota bacterium]
MLTIKARLVLAYTVTFGILLVVFATAIYRGTRLAGLDRLDARLRSYAARVQEKMESAAPRGPALPGGGPAPGLDDAWQVAEHAAGGVALTVERHEEDGVPGFAVKVLEDSLLKEVAISAADGRVMKIEVGQGNAGQRRAGPAFDVRDFALVPADGLQGLRLQVYGREGQVVVPDSALGASPTPLWQAALKGSSAYEVRRLGGQDYRCLWTPFEAHDVVYALEAAAPMAELNSELERLSFEFSIIIPLALCLAGAAAYLLSKAAFRPVTRMARTARSITAASLDQQLELSAADDEIRMLGETLNEMIRRIEGAFRSQKRFVADASHEIRTPLTAIQIELEFAERHSRDAAALGSIRVALAEIGRLNDLTASLLLLSRLDAAQLTLSWQPTRIDELLLECVQSMKLRVAEQEIDLRVCIAEAITVSADREQLKRVFLNLIDNAVKYSGGKSNVRVSLDRPDPAQVRVRVVDNGPGIPAAGLPHLFQRFYRSDETRAAIEGSGLGLAIARELVELHGGTIQVRSEAGGETEFAVFLPA